MVRCEFRAGLADILAGAVPSYALVHRPRSGGAGTVEVLAGPARTVERLDELPVRSTLAILPYRQLTERGLACHDDGTPLVALDIRDRRRVPLDVVMDALPSVRPTLASGGFDLDDEAYGESVRRIVTDEIGRGAGSSFVIRRRFTGRLAGYTPHHALAVFRALLARERGTYWTFLVHWDGRTLVGASPERHASLRDGVAAMSPISGTFPYPPGGPTVPDLLRFLADGKEAEELYMVVDEELKMMGRVCDGGGRLVGPRLAEMARLAHTEYRIEGRTRLDARELLRETMFAPTVTGSPLTNACRVIARHEPDGRGYYGGVIALAGWRRGRPVLDSAILIRTADISADGRVEFGVGATLVRRSDPASEAAETRAKAAGVLGAFADFTGTPARAGVAATSATSRHELGRDPQVRRALAGRNAGLARFWLDPGTRGGLRTAGLVGRRVLLVDGEDAFTEMLAHQLRALGPAVTLRPWTEPYEPGHDAVVIGPGPGDPRDRHRPKIAALRALTARVLDSGVPVLSICLGHQILAALLGLPPRRRPVPAQGERREIDFFGRTERVGFYNTFAAYSDADTTTHPLVPGVIEIGRDRYTGEVHGLRAAGLRSLQFHPESVLTENGPRILSDLLSSLLGRRA